MLQMEISQEIIAESDTEVKLNLADDVMRLLQVREKNKEMTKDWLLFISTSNFKLTAGEIFLAFKMALSRELLDSKGNEFDLFPELSINATGKILHAYLKHKNDNIAYQRSKDLLRKKKQEEEEESKKNKEEEDKKRRAEFLFRIYKDIKESGYSDVGWIVYDKMFESGIIKITDEEKKEMYDSELKIFKKEEKDRIKNENAISSKYLLKEFNEKLNSGKPLVYVVNRCKNLLVSKHLSQFIEDTKEFERQIPE